MSLIGPAVYFRAARSQKRALSVLPSMSVPLSAPRRVAHAKVLVIADRGTLLIRICMHRMDWNLARAFCATADCGSLSAAARKIGLTQPTLSRQVAALEDALGVT
ncbi:MAG TPA: LysR family transcriptional regulator, partial [Caulobacteraceae bacterium]|nr:LysR family transcriptional regulator [Caulobacteraceae bacterium]